MINHEQPLQSIDPSNHRNAGDIGFREITRAFCPTAWLLIAMTLGPSRMHVVGFYESGRNNVQDVLRDVPSLHDLQFNHSKIMILTMEETDEGYSSYTIERPQIPGG